MSISTISLCYHKSYTLLRVWGVVKFIHLLPEAMWDREEALFAAASISLKLNDSPTAYTAVN